MQTPNLHQMAQEGVRFSDFYCGATVCSPSRATLMTGRHTGHTNVRAVVDVQQNERGIRSQDTTVAEALSAAGYHTAMFGKWHLMDEQVPEEEMAHNEAHPNEQGFDEFLGAIRSRTAQEHYPTELWENREKVTFPENEYTGPEYLRPDETYQPRLYTERTLEYLEDHQDDSFFLYYATPLVHAPNVVPDNGPYEDEPWPPGEKAHAARVTLLDEYVGQILDKLRDLGIADETLVLFMSDNGPHNEGGYGIYPQARHGYVHDPEFFDSNHPFDGYKANLYEGGIRSPLIAWSPGLLEDSAGTITNEPAAHWDIFPTVADYAGVEVPPDLDGISLRPTLEGRQQDGHDHLYFFRDEYAPWPRTIYGEQGRYDMVCEAVRRDNWKLLRWTPSNTMARPVDWREVPQEARQVELYDLSNDIQEDHDLSLEHPDIVEELVEVMEEENVPRPVEREPFEPGCARGKGSRAD